MKVKFKMSVTTVMVLMFLLAVSCKDKSEEKVETSAEQTEAVEKEGKEYTSTYVCPMHCEGSGSDSEGTCPDCGMAYVLNEEHKKDGHTH